MVPGIVQALVEGGEVFRVVVGFPEFNEAAQHNGCEPYVAFLQQTEGLSAFRGVFAEEVVVAGFCQVLGIGQVLGLAGNLVKQGGCLHHLSAVVSEFGVTYFPVQGHVVEIQVVRCVLQVGLRPFIQCFPLCQVAAVLCGAEQFQGKD